MMLPFFALLKMSGHGVQICPSKPLLVWWSNILIFLGPFLLGMLTSFFQLGRWGLFIVFGASSLWRWEDSLTFVVMMVFRGWQSHHYPAGGWQRSLGGWFAITIVFSLYRWRRAGRLKRPRKVLSSMLLAKWVIIAYEIRSGILFGMPTTGSGLDVRIGGGCAMCQFMWSSGQEVGRAMCPTEECLVRPPRIRLGVVPTGITSGFD